MIVLALETATAACSVALWRDGGVAARRFAALGRGHAEALVPMIAEVLAEAGVAAADADRIAVTVGPGAFTGLRVGLATARGLALATGRPVVGVTTFDAVAHGLPPMARPLLVAVDSRRRELFLQRYDAARRPDGEPVLLDPDACAAWLPPGPLTVAGDGAAALSAVLAGRADTLFADGPGLPDAAVVARLAAGLAPGGGLPPRPLYLRAPDAIPARREPAS